MIYKEATQRIRFQFNNFNICPLCRREIARCETFEYISYYEGRYKYFVLFHTACLAEAHSLIRAFKNGKTHAVYTKVNPDAHIFSVDEALKRELLLNRDVASTQIGGVENAKVENNE